MTSVKCVRFILKEKTELFKNKKFYWKTKNPTIIEAFW